MLNPNWEKVYQDKDWDLWKRLSRFYLGKKQYDIDSIYPDDKANINYLLNKYYVSKYGSSVNLNDKNLYTKLDMLQRVMTELQHAEPQASKQWEERQLQEESLDARLEREKGMWEAREGSIKLSKRDK